MASVTSITEDGKTYIVVTTEDDISYKIPAEQGFILWRKQASAGGHTLEELISPPPGKGLNVFGIIMQSGSGTIYVYQRAPDGTPTLAADSSVSAMYTWADSAPLEIQDGGSLSFSCTLTGAAWILAYGLIV